MLKPLLLSLMLVGSISAAHAESKTYGIDRNHTKVHATFLHFGFANVTIRFNALEGEFLFDAAKPSNSKLNLRLPLSGLDSGVNDFDDHLRSDDFFDVEKFPEATFQSTKITDAGKGKLKLLGNLTIRGITKPVTFDVAINRVGIHPMAKRPAAGFDAVAIIKRSDFGLGKYVPNVSDEVTLKIAMEAIEPKK